MKNTAPTPAEIQRALGSRVGKPTNPETPIVNSCIEYLNILPGIRVWRNNVGEAEFENSEGESRFVKFGFEGMSDIFGVQRLNVPGRNQALWPLVVGRFITIEVKVPGKEPTTKQQSWLEQMAEMGAVAFWCDSIDSCMAQAKKWGLA